MKKPYCCYKLLRLVEEYYQGKITKIYTQSRRSTIMPKFVGVVIYVHNGRRYNPIYIVDKMVGYKLGSFAHTRQLIKHTRK
ncbi:ribosomal protein S19 family protein [Candidatus Vidania fulgoroideorum]